MDPFDDPIAEARVVIDGHGQPSLWPAVFPVPFGWITALCPAPREEAEAYLHAHYGELAIPGAAGRFSP